MNGLALPLVWAAILGFAVLMYVVLDGFDLGVGMLFPFARNRADRDTMMNTIAPVWDGNETWLVLGGGGLLAAFPLAYSILMPALYLPVLMMLAGLVLRGVAFEFRARGVHHGYRFWTGMFSVGSLLATAAQGLILGGFIQGVAMEGQRFSGGPLDWLTPYSLLVSAGLVCGYALLGASWLVLKTEDELHGDARRWTLIATVAVAVALALVSVATLALHRRVAMAWGIDPGALGIDWSRLAPRLAIPALGLGGLILTWGSARRRSHRRPFVGALLVFLSGLMGLAVGFLPYLVPYALTVTEAAAPANALVFMLVGAAIIVPLILAYTIGVYWVFRGKVAADAGYH